EGGVEEWWVACACRGRGGGSDERTPASPTERGCLHRQARPQAAPPGPGPGKQRPPPLPAVRRRRAPRLHVPTRPRAVRAGQDARAPNERRPQEQCVARQRRAAPTDRLPPPERYERSRTTAAGSPPSPRDRQRRTDHLPDRRQAHEPCPRSLWPTTAREPASQRQARTEARPP